MKKTFFVFLLSMSVFLFIACGGGGGGGGSDGSGTSPEELYTLSVTTVGSGDVSYTDPGSDGGYANGDKIDLTAEPADGWRFDHWEGGVTGSNKTVSVTVKGDLAVTAVFIQQFNLTTSYSGNGTVSVNPSLSVFDKDQEVVITASADSGWNFDHWSGSITSTDNPLTVTMDADKTITAVFVKPSTISIEQIKQVLHAAYSGIGYGIGRKYDSDAGVYYTYTDDDSKLYGIEIEDLRWLCDATAVSSILSLSNNITSLTKLGLMVEFGIYEKFENLSVNGLNVSLYIDPDGPISTISGSPSPVSVKMTVSVPSSGYLINNMGGYEITYKGVNSSDLVFEGDGYAYIDMDNFLFGLYFESFTLAAASTLSATYDDHLVQYKGWTITASSMENKGKKLNYYIGPLSLYEMGAFPSPVYDDRFYKLNGTFSVDGGDYFYDMLYGQFDGRYCPTKVDANAKYIGMKGSIKIPSLGGNLINISSAGSDVFEDIFNGKDIDDVVLSDLTEAIKIAIVPDTGVWKTGSLSMIPPGYASGWDAVFSSDGSVEIDPGNYKVDSWQTALEFIN